MYARRLRERGVSKDESIAAAERVPEESCYGDPITAADEELELWAEASEA